MCNIMCIKCFMLHALYVLYYMYRMCIILHVLDAYPKWLRNDEPPLALSIYLFCDKSRCFIFVTVIMLFLLIMFFGNLFLYKVMIEFLRVLGEKFFWQ